MSFKKSEILTPGTQITLKVSQILKCLGLRGGVIKKITRRTTGARGYKFELFQSIL